MLFVSAMSMHCGDDRGVTDDPAPVPVQLDFAFRVNGEDFSCGTEYQDVGDPPAAFSSTDARLYLSGIELVDDNGNARTIALDTGPFQNDGVALLDFEDGCGSDGTPETNSVVKGTIVPGSYTKVRFTLGLPDEKNFIDLTKAKAPLDVTGMFWTWQYGYKFLKLDGSSPAEDGPSSFFIHLGASGCPGDNPQQAPSGACESPNRIRYELSDFTPGQHTIVAELANVLATSDLSFNTDGTAPGCMSESDDPECQAILPLMGIDDPKEQVLFVVE